MCRVYFSLGSNQGDRFSNLQQALQHIEQRIGSVEKISSYYETEPWGFVDEISFINQAIKIETDLSAKKVLERILLIEKLHGRQRIDNQSEYTGRTLDIDIIFYNHEIINENSLIVPHKLLHLRKFVLEPLNEIEPDFIHPVLNKTVFQLLKECPDTTKVQRLNGKDILSAVA